MMRNLITGIFSVFVILFTCGRNGDERKNEINDPNIDTIGKDTSVIIGSPKDQPITICKPGPGG